MGDNYREQVGGASGKLGNVLFLDLEVVTRVCSLGEEFRDVHLRYVNFPGVCYIQILKYILAYIMCQESKCTYLIHMPPIWLHC